MDLIQVDPKLFITCRLCVEEMGQYQIVPSVQEKIKYCFDIDVKPFDGLPQLICDKCNKVLTNVAQWKQSYTEKQQNLIIKAKKNDPLKNDNVPVCITPKTLVELDHISASSTSLQPQQDTVSSSQQVLENNEVSESKSTIKQKRLSNYSSNGNASEKSYASIKKVRKENETVAWKRNYKRKMVCKICNSLWTNKKMLAYHYKKNHINLCQKYMSILDKNCFVKLTKVDDALNFTGQNNTVVFDVNRIVEEGNEKFYILYSKDPDGSELTTQSEYSKPLSSSSDDEVIIKPKTINKKRRLVSRSSNETVVIGNSKIRSDSEDDTEFNDNVSPSRNVLNSQDECINIVDSSGSDRESDNKTSDTRTKQVMKNEASFNDYKVIQGILSRCVKSYESKNELTVDMHARKTDTQTSTESQMQHKIISIGRKVITKQGFNCTGLLRYLEYKNLEIVWVRKQTVFGMKDANYIRILTKLRDARETYYNNKWVKVDVPPIERSCTPVAEQVEISNTENENEDSAVIYCNPPESDSKILLNENPVANPKKLTKSKKPCVKNKDEVICMPIITSTTSLAKIPEKLPTEKTDSIATIACVEEAPPLLPLPPRIKVKSVAELMSDKPLCRFEPAPSTNDANSSSSNVLQAENVWPPQNGLNVYVAPQTHFAVNIHSSNISIDEIGTSKTNVSGSFVDSSKKESITLDTIELPNTVTGSPYLYIRNLLQLHNLFLKDPMENLSHDYFCLVKFKVLFNQDSADPPVVLCLSLFNSNNTFCLKLRDQKQMAIDINKLSANWQWEILQIYRGELVRRKALQNAQKVSQETHDLTNNFLCVLKSVNKLS